MAKSTTRTIRLDQDLNEAIEKLAREDKVSVNWLVNSALREAVEWSFVVPKLGVATFPKYITDKLLARLTNEECEELGEQAGREFTKPFAEFRFGNPTLEDYIETIRVFAKYTGQFNFLAKYGEGGKIVLIVKHNSGIKWSHMYKGTGEYIFHDRLHRNVVHELTDSHVVATISQS